MNTSPRVLPTSDRCRVLITQVNPFEDVPGYQYAQLLGASPDFDVAICDDSPVVVSLMGDAGYAVFPLQHPHTDPDAFADALRDRIDAVQPEVVIPGSDAHLFMLARMLLHSPALRRLCPPAGWLADRRILNKWDLQDFVARYLPTPARWSTMTVGEVSERLSGGGKLVVKGMLKEARVLEYPDEESVAIRQLRQNPANQGEYGGFYYEEFLDGAEHCLLLVQRQDRTVRLGLRKLAATRSGTTMVGELEDAEQYPLDTSALGRELTPGLPLELEWRATRAGPKVFEANFRFPSWVGALGPFGEALVRSSTSTQAGRPAIARAPRPKPGTRLVRLPHSGAFSRPGSEPAPGAERQPLWRTASPHQFIIK